MKKDNTQFYKIRSKIVEILSFDTLIIPLYFVICNKSHDELCFELSRVT